ncbi:MAG: DUF6265 family protein [Candidatus Eisenbacteria bacterium]
MKLVRAIACRPVRPALVGLTLLALLGPARAEDSDARFMDHIAWIAGCWENHYDNGSYDEQWMAPKGNLMLGMSRTVIAGQAIEHEFLRIVEENDQLLYFARPSGQEEVVFRAAQLSDSLVMFVNPQHDFPQRICYQRNRDGSMLAWIDGQHEGEPRRVEFPMRRTQCP